MNKKLIKACLLLALLLASNSLFANKYYDKQYMNAIKKGKIEKVKKLLESRKVKLNTLTLDYGNTVYRHSPLAIACANHSYDIAIYLINKGADLNGTFGYKTPLTWAAKKSRIRTFEKIFLPIIKLMLSKGADPNEGGRYGYYPLMLAASNNAMDIVKLLLKHGAKKNLMDSDGDTAADYARKSGHIEMANFLEGKSNDAYRSTLLYAAKTGDLKKASRILKNAGSNLSTLLRKKEKSSDYTALIYASRYGHLEIVKLLISYGAPINSISKGNFNALSIAAAFGKVKVALFLLQFGANPNVVQRSGCAAGYTAFYWAVGNNLTSLIKAMWDKGNINYNTRGQSVFFAISALNNSFNTLQFLVEYCKLTPPLKYLNYIKGLTKGKYRGFYLKFFRYLKSKGFYKNNHFSSSYSRRRLKNPFLNNKTKQDFEPYNINKRLKR